MKLSGIDEVEFEVSILDNIPEIGDLLKMMGKLSDCFEHKSRGGS